MQDPPRANWLSGKSEMLIAASGKCYTAVIELLVGRGVYMNNTNKIQQLWFGNLSSYLYL